MLPLVIYGIASLVNRGDGGNEEGWWGRWWGGEEGGGGGGENQGWWRWGNGGEAQRENQGRGALAFVYLWSLALFALLVWRGNRVLSNNKDDRALFAALVVFANLAFLCWIMIAGLGVRNTLSRSECLVRKNYRYAVFSSLSQSVRFMFLDATGRRGCGTRLA